VRHVLCAGERDAATASAAIVSVHYYITTCRRPPSSVRLQWTASQFAQECSLRAAAALSLSHHVSVFISLRVCACLIGGRQRPRVVFLRLFRLNNGRRLVGRPADCLIPYETFAHRTGWHAAQNAPRIIEDQSTLRRKFMLSRRCSFGNCAMPALGGRGAGLTWFIIISTTGP